MNHSMKHSEVIWNVQNPTCAISIHMFQPSRAKNQNTFEHICANIAARQKMICAYWLVNMAWCLLKVDFMQIYWLF